MSRPRAGGRRGRALLLGAGLAIAAWGLATTLPHLGAGGPGFLAKGLYPVLAWSLLGGACLVGLAALALRR